MNIIQRADELLEDLKDLYDELEMKKDVLADKEPDSDGSGYDKWSDRMDSLDSVVDELDNLIDSFNSFTISLSIHQGAYGGLKR